MKLKTLIIKGKHINIYPFSREKVVKEFENKTDLELHRLENSCTILTNDITVLHMDLFRNFFDPDNEITAYVYEHKFDINIRGIRNAIEVKDINGEVINVEGLIGIVKTLEHNKHNISATIYECSNYRIEYNYRYVEAAHEYYTEELSFYYTGRPAFKLNN